MRNTLKYFLIDFIVTFGFLGKIKYAPGTLGSLMAFLIFYLVYFLVIPKTELIMFHITNLGQFDILILNLMIVLFLILCTLFIIGFFCSSAYVKRTNKEDPQEIIIDEVVGQLIVITLTLPGEVAILLFSNLNQYLNQTLFTSLSLFIMPLIIFRAFDIVKPWPINWIDKKIKGGMGIMLDDVVAAIFASLFWYGIIFFIISYFGMNPGI